MRDDGSYPGGAASFLAKPKSWQSIMTHWNPFQRCSRRWCQHERRAPRRQDRPPLAFQRARHRGMAEIEAVLRGRQEEN